MTSALQRVLPDGSHPARWIALPVVCVAELIVTADNLIVAVTLPTLVRELGATTSQLQWIVDAYILVFAVLLLAAGSLADRFGRRKILIIGLAWFAAASAAASITTSPGQLIAARAVMGIGAALIFPATLAALSDMFRDRQEKTIAIGVWSATTGIAIAAGPLLGGFLLEHYHWGSVFWINIPIAIVGIIGALWVVRESTDPDFGRLDWPGMALSIVGLVVLVATIIEAPHLGWSSPTVLAGFTVAAVTIAGFLAWQHRATHPMFDLRFFKDRRFRGGNIAILTASVIVFAYAFLGVQYLQFVLDLTPLEAGLTLLPFALATATAAPLATIAATRWGYRPVISAGVATLVAAAVLTARLDVASTRLEVTVGMVLFGLALGIITGPGTEAIMGSLPERYAGVGSASNDTTRELGAALGIAIGGSLAASTYVTAITTGFDGTAMPPEGLAAAQDSIGGADEVARIANDEFGADIANWITGIADQAFMDGWSTAMWAMALIGAASGVIVYLTLPTRDEQPDQPMHLDPDPTETSDPPETGHQGVPEQEPADA